MAWRQEIIEGGFPVWVNEPKSKPFLDEALDHLDDSFSTRMGYICQPKKLKFNLRSVVKCPKTERLEKRLGSSKKQGSLWQKANQSGSRDEECFDDMVEDYEEESYNNTPSKENSIFKRKPDQRFNKSKRNNNKKKSRGWLGQSTRREGMWKK